MDWAGLATWIWAWLVVVFQFIWAALLWLIDYLTPLVHEFSFSWNWLVRAAVHISPFFMLWVCVSLFWRFVCGCCCQLKLNFIAYRLKRGERKHSERLKKQGISGKDKKGKPITVHNPERAAKIAEREILLSMNWRDFEKMVQDIFKAKGYKVRRQGGGSKDGGIDLLVEKGREKSMVQCKRYKSSVSVKVVREMWGLKEHHNFSKVYIYTSGWFTQECYSFAKGKNIILQDGKNIVKEMELLR